LQAIRAYDLDAIAPTRADALFGEKAVNGALDRNRDFVESTYRPVAPVCCPQRHLERGMGCLPQGMGPQVHGLYDLPALPAF
jgi:hypothetical protein